MKPTLQLKIGQQLTMTPQLQQAIRLLQLSTIDLQQEIQETVESNPMLEIAEPDAGSTQEQSSVLNGELQEEPAIREASSTSSQNELSEDRPDNRDDNGDSWDEHISNDLPVDSVWGDVYQDMPSGSQSGGEMFSGAESITGSVTTLQDHLHWQLNLTPMSDLDRVIAITIIDSVQPDGYLDSDIESIHRSVVEQLEAEDQTSGDSDPSETVEPEEIEAVLRRLQHFDPIGVCARDLGECLRIQLDQLAPETPWLEQAKAIVKQHIALLGTRDYNQLMRRTKLKEADLQQVLQLIRGLHPKPGDTISESAPEYVIPDVIVKKERGRWQVELNPEVMPKVHINATYAAMIRRADTSSDNTYMRNHLQEARWFLKSIQSRNETLLKVASRIVEIQQDFLEYGEEAMKPLVLHDIAKSVEMHESTISRVTTQKYMHTPRGIFELKYFFSSHVDTQSGGVCSSTAIRAIIKKLVSAELPNKPLSDSKIADILSQQGIKVARRTIAKYREALMIPPSNERKRLV